MMQSVLGELDLEHQQHAIWKPHTQWGKKKYWPIRKAYEVKRQATEECLNLLYRNKNATKNRCSRKFWTTEHVKIKPNKSYWR